MLASVEHGAKNRLATVFFYLNNVTSAADGDAGGGGGGGGAAAGGGATNFPRAATAAHPNGGPRCRDY